MENQKKEHEYIQIRAVYDDEKVRVYQAYCPEIAEEAVKLGTFGEHFSLKRMTWIKPSFLWMMYRCGWAQKEGQERVLAIDIKREAFDYMLENAVLSVYYPEMGISQEEWKQQIAHSDVRCQWDPERDIHGNPLPYRSVQIGIRGRAVRKYVGEWILGIEDITEQVKFTKAQRSAHKDISEYLPQERVYPMTEAATEKFKHARH